jgi:hypothetical protein
MNGSFCFNADTELLASNREMFLGKQQQPATDLVKRKRIL